MRAQEEHVGGVGAGTQLVKNGLAVNPKSRRACLRPPVQEKKKRRKNKIFSLLRDVLFLF
jgi:endonuclease YncB( thermonuclease family)